MAKLCIYAFNSDQNTVCLGMNNHPAEVALYTLLLQSTDLYPTIVATAWKPGAV